jgi:hypothetical protein
VLFVLLDSSILWVLHFLSGGFPIILWIIVACTFLPCACALAAESPFPDIPFKVFNHFVKHNFDDTITLAQVLLVLFTVTDNPDLLNLHARQQHPKYRGEKKSESSGWIRCLARALYEKMGDGGIKLLQEGEYVSGDKNDGNIIDKVGTKLDKLVKTLKLKPYSSKGVYQGKLTAVSHESFQPAQVLCPITMECETLSCDPRSLLQFTQTRDIPRVTLIKGSTMYSNVQLLAGKCPRCKTLYYADHERSPEAEQKWTRVYLNDAKYLKAGQSLWVDRVFSGSILNAMYSFHASAAAYTDFWNNSYWEGQSKNTNKISRHQVWNTFVQESVRTVASEAGINLQLPDGLPTDELTKQAFSALGENGIIQAADQHACNECTQPYKKTADIITGDDPAALVGVDEQRAVPRLVGEGAELAAQAASHASNQPQRRPGINLDMDVDMDVNHALVKMVVVDGLVVGPQKCSIDDCTTDLENHRGGVFCEYHQVQFGARCRVRGCNDNKVAGTQACERHEAQWNTHIRTHNRQTFSGAKRMLQTQRPGNNSPWLRNASGYSQPHDQPVDEPERKNYFTASRFYCVETICAPCGVVIAWAKFAKAESPTNILQFLESVYPTEESRPEYVCIDKACLVLRTAIANGSWESVWEPTTRFIVDSYHYINHRSSDYMCRKWCNPAPLNGSAPNLVVVAEDNRGNPYYKRAFNTQV